MEKEKKGTKETKRKAGRETNEDRKTKNRAKEQEEIELAVKE